MFEEGLLNNDTAIVTKKKNVIVFLQKDSEGFYAIDEQFEKSLEEHA